ncbi:periplasmic heavy metal sensor [Desulfobacter curvatus]|uniref:periplasmic heavy metal sensor n=1 Tax=Desulfobacter curvatus TaxID=2290 RepID=UPI00035C1B9A|nr:periplasmic heavy metal sensor [Desulfobacter curvatus]
MTNFSLKKVILFGTIFLITGFTAYAFAHGEGYHMGGGYGSGMMGGYGMMGDGYHMMGGYGHMWNDLSPKDQQLMHDQMDKFFASTQDLRKQYYEKRVELNQEYAKSEKDQARISALEKDLFDISSKIEKARFENMNEMHKLFEGRIPDGYMMGAGRGYGGCY